MTDKKQTIWHMQGWPILLTCEMAALYLSLDPTSFLAFTERMRIAPMDAGEGQIRWHRYDLEKAARKLPAIPEWTADRPRTVLLDAASIRQIVEQLRDLQPPVAQHPVPELVSLKDAVRTLGVGRSKIYRLINEGAIEVKHIGRRTLIPRTEIERILKGGLV